MREEGGGRERGRWREGGGKSVTSIEVERWVGVRGKGDGCTWDDVQDVWDDTRAWAKVS